MNHGQLYARRSRLLPRGAAQCGPSLPPGGRARPRSPHRNRARRRHERLVAHSKIPSPDRYRVAIIARHTMTDSPNLGQHVLTVDDEVPAVEQMQWLLEAGLLVAKVYTATDVAEAKEIMDQHRIDVVLLDIHMPGTTGMDLAQELRRQEAAETPHVVFVTADARPAVHAFELDALDYLLKPGRPARLPEAWRQTLTRRDTGRPAEVPG